MKTGNDVILLDDEGGHSKLKERAGESDVLHWTYMYEPVCIKVDSKIRRSLSTALTLSHACLTARCFTLGSPYIFTLLKRSRILSGSLAL